MNIICDIDDTVCELVSEWLKIYNYDNGDNLKKKDITDWNISSFTKIGNLFYDYLSDSVFNLYNNVKPVKNSLKYITELKKKHRVIFVTAFDFNNRKYNWLVSHKYIKSLQDFVVCEDKSLIKGDIMIDDKVDNLLSFSGIGILMNQPWNKKLQYNKLRFNNWDEIYKAISEIEKC